MEPAQIIEANKLIAEFMQMPSERRKEVVVYGINTEDNAVKHWDRYSTKSISDEKDTIYYAFLPEEMRFHESWDWLMPVVEKIETTIWPIDINTNELTKKRGITHAEMITFEMYNPDIKKWCFNFSLEKTALSFSKDVHSETKIEAYYKAVICFIQWYNQQAK